MPNNKHKSSASTKDKPAPSKRLRTDDEHVDEICDSIDSINNSSVMSKLVSKLLANDLFVQTIQSSFNIPSLVAEAVQPLQAQVSYLTRRVDDMEQYSRRNCLKISGIPNHQGSRDSENTDELLINLFNTKLGLSIGLNDISRSHRVARFDQNPSTSRRPDDIIVRFNSYRIRDQVYRARFSLKSVHKGQPAGNRIFINEALTSQRALLFRDARSLVNKGLALKAKTSDGTIVITDLHHRNHRITTTEQLNSVFPVNSSISHTPAPSTSPDINPGRPASTPVMSPVTSTPIQPNVNLHLSVVRGNDGVPVSASIKPDYASVSAAKTGKS